MMGQQNPMLNQMMGGGAAGMNPMMQMMGQQGPLLPTMPQGGSEAKSDPLTMLMGGLNGLSTNLFGSSGNMQTCNLPRKLDCMAAPDKLDSSEIWKMNQKCSIKGCCWDHQKAQQMVLGDKLDSLSSMMMMQCPYKVIAKVPSMPDLTADAEGCCDVSPCVHVAPPAEWTSWAEWSQCTAPCGGGVSVRSRSCEGHGFCPGMVGDSREQIIEQRCNTNLCESWAEWSQFGPCSTTCGMGEHTRTRSCFSYRENRMIDSAPGCAGLNYDKKQCQNQRCPTWSTWSQWNACPTTCGLGRQTRSRSCQYGMTCPGSSQEFTTCGNRGVNASVKSAKSVVMDHDHVFAGVLVSLASPAVEETQSKKAFVVLVSVSGVSGLRHQSVKLSNQAVVSDRQLIHDLATVVPVLVLVTRPRRKCVNWKPVLVSANGVNGRPALLHAATESNRDHELAMVNSILTVLVVLTTKRLVPKLLAQIVDGTTTTAGIATPAAIAGTLEVVRALEIAGIATVGTRKTHNQSQLKLRLTTTHGLICSAVTIIFLVA